MSWITQLTTILSLLPAIISAIKAIEEAIPGQGKGEAKLTAIREIIEAVSSQAGALWPQIQTVIGILVNLFNKSGIFQKAA